MCQHRLDLLTIEEPGPDVVLCQHRDVGSRHQRAVVHRQRIHPLQGRELPVDLGVRGACRLPLVHEAPRVGRRDARHPPPTEERRQVLSDPSLHMAERLAPVGPVLRDDALGGPLEPHPANARGDGHPALDVPLTTPQEPLRVLVLPAPGALVVAAAAPRVLDPPDFPAFVDAPHVFPS